MTKADYNEIMKLRGFVVSDPEYRAMLQYIEPKCYVESSSTHQSGTVQSVIYNIHKVPVCVKVDSGEGGVDYISIDRIDFWEPFCEYVSDLSEYCDGCGCGECLAQAGYVWDEDRGAYYNAEKDDEIEW